MHLETCFAQDVMKDSSRMRRLLIRMVNYGTLNVSCKYHCFKKNVYRKLFHKILLNFSFCIGVLNAFVHFKMESSMNLKVVNIVNVIFMFYLHHAAINAVNLLLVELSKQWQLIGIHSVSVVKHAAKN